MEPVYVVKVSGFIRVDEAEAIAAHARKVLDGKVLVVDERVDDVWAIAPDCGGRLVRMLAWEDLKDLRFLGIDCLEEEE